MSGKVALPAEGKRIIHGNVTGPFKATGGQLLALCWAKALKHNGENITVKI